MVRHPDDTSTDRSRWQGDETSLARRQLADSVHAWQEDADAPQLHNFLPAEPPELRQFTLVELIKLDLEYRWQSGLRKTLPDYIAEFPELGSSPPADLIHEEYLVRKRAGDEVSWEEYRTLYPDRMQELTRLFGGRGTNTVAMQQLGSERTVPGSWVEPGHVVDDFEVLLHLGQGAFANVFLARQISMQRRVALKITSPQGEEHATLAQFDHPNIVRIYDQRLLESHGWRLLYMQYVPGGTLRHVVNQVRETPPHVRTGRLLFEVIDHNLRARHEPTIPDAPLRIRWAQATWPEVVCWLGARIARALDYAHCVGVLHRDLKPANVLLAADGTPKLADFNVSFNSQSDSLHPTTSFGGSLAYMSPEQLEAYNPSHPRLEESLDGRSDLYSLGITLHELLRGTRPFAAETSSGKWSERLDQMTAMRRAGPPIDSWKQDEAHWPAGLSQILARLMAPAPDQRFASGVELAQELDLCLQPSILRILFPQHRQWRWQFRRLALPAFLTLVLIPNLLAAAFNFQFQSHQPAALLASSGVPWGSVMFGLGALIAGGLLCLWRGLPVIRAVQSRRSDSNMINLQSPMWRARCLRLGPESATISLGAWMLLSVGCLAVLRLTAGAEGVGPLPDVGASMLLGGLISVAYPYVGVSSLAVGVLYPGLVQPGRFSVEERRELRQLRQNSWLFLLLAAVMPLAAIALSILRDQNEASRGQRIELIGLALAGIVGLSLSMLSFRTLQHDLQTFLWMSASRHDSHDSLDDAGSWLAPDL